MAEKYYSILTNRGKELEAQSSATGKPVIIKDFAVGDGNGQPVKPDPAQTKLVREVYRNAISALQVSPDQTNQFIAQLVLATGLGGFVVREVGLLTDSGELYSVANCAAIEKPENGVSVNLQYRLAVSETASIELKVATGDGLFLRQDANLSDVKDVVKSRKSLGLKGAAVLDVGKVANTVAAGDDTRIVNALQKNNNLSDLADKVLARANLQLKTAAVADIQTSKDDVTVGRVLVNGSALALRTVLAGAGRPVTDFDDLPGNSVSFGYSDATNSPGFTGSVIDYSGTNGGYRVQIAAQYNGNGNHIAFRTRNGDAVGAWNPWGELYHTRNKPTAGDVGAVAKTGDTMTGALTVPGVSNTGDYFLRNLVNRHIRFEYLKNDGTWVTDGYIYKDGVDSPNRRPGVRINCATPDKDKGNTTNSGEWVFGEDGNLTCPKQVVPGSYANFDARYQAKGNYTPAGQAYTKAESDGKYQLKGNYALVGASYTKAETDARYGVVNAMRRGGQQLRNPTDAFFGNWESPAGCVVTGITMENRSDGRKLGVYYRQMQYLNKQTGAWVNVGD
ncbi:phage tail-collar fiber domain-containing protein [Enterobacter sp. 22466]|uniref:phage tail protein n=1 Tax=Enterobacter sp. 22466 TaxID=3453924 RepID=UPI003F8692AE